MIFLHQPIDPFETDPDHELRHDDYAKTSISIRDCTGYGSGFVVMEYGPEGTALADVWMRTVSTHKTLAEAKRAALAYWHTR